MSNSQAKYLLILSLAARWLVDEIFNPHFVADVVHNFAKTDFAGQPSTGVRSAMAAANGKHPGISAVLRHQF
jgi:hypothetical protein